MNIKRAKQASKNNGQNKNVNSSGIIQLGFIEKGTGKHQSNVVYSVYGISATVCAMWGVKQPSLMVIVNEHK